MTQDRREAGSRPGWRGPGLTKTSKGSQKLRSSKANEGKPSSSSVSEESCVPTELQQQMLNIYKHAFPTLSEGGAGALKPLLQEVKQALFERDFERTFGREDYLEVYAFRWSPSRALCYISILVDLTDHLRNNLLFQSMANDRRLDINELLVKDAQLSGSYPIIHVVCLGGGAAEVVAFGGLQKYLTQESEPSVTKSAISSIAEATKSLVISEDLPSKKINLLIIDAATWSSVIHKLFTSLTTPPPLSKYASAAAKASNIPFLPPDALATHFQRSNLLSLTVTELKQSLSPQPGQRKPPQLITLLFTLNELYTTSITQTTAFLLNLTLATARGTLLLVVDSPGSYSEAMVGEEDNKKKYPMQWLMDRTLLGDRRSATSRGEKEEKKEESGSEWEKLVGDESRWFRMPEELKYPISLENMRYQVHLFRRL